MPTRTESALVAVFGNPFEAQAAAKELVTNAFAGNRIHIVSQAQPDPSTNTSGGYPGAGRHDQDVERWLVSVFGQASKTECQHYEEAVREGKAVVGVSTPDQMVDRAAEILNHHSPIKTMLARVPQPRA